MEIKQGIDCSTPLNEDKANKFKAGGYDFVCRYLVPSGYSKHLSKAEAKILSDAGLEILSVFETTASRPKGGAVNGKADAKTALKCAIDIGQPKGSAIYFCCDWDITLASEYDATENYLRAAAIVLAGQYEVGLYGEFSIIEEMFKRKACKHFWQTYAWSGGKRSKYANVYQYRNSQTVYGHSVDLNNSFGNEGFWTYKKVEQKPSRPSTPAFVVDGKKTDLEYKNIDGFNWVQLRDIVEALGGSVAYDHPTNTITITSKK